MNREDLRARVRRLEELAASLSREESLWRKCNAPVLAVDRQEYMAAIGDAINWYYLCHRTCHPTTPQAGRSQEHSASGLPLDSLM